MTVVDGDTNARVRGARVTIGSRSAAERPARRGPRSRCVHRTRARHAASRSAATTRAFGALVVPHASEVDDPDLPALAAVDDVRRRTPRARRTQPGLDVRPPFRVVWSRGLGTLIEFPAVVQDGVAYIANARGTVRALDMRNGNVIWRHDTPHGKMAASPAVWGDELIVHGMDGHVWVLRRSDGHAPLALHRRLARRVVARRSSTEPTCSVPGTGRSPRSTCARTASVGAATTAAR